MGIPWARFAATPPCSSCTCLFANADAGNPSTASPAKRRAIHKPDHPAYINLMPTHEPCGESPNFAELLTAPLMRLLTGAARAGRILTYAEVAKTLQLRPPYTIHQAALLMERLMRSQAARSEPQLASFVVSKARAGMPAPGFFVLAAELGLYDGTDEGPEARAFVEAERARCRAQFFPPN